MLSKDKLFFLCCLFFFMGTLGVEMEYYPWEEHNVIELPTLFVKHDVNFQAFFEAPTPGEMLRPSRLTTQENHRLINYCHIRFGTTLPECRKKLFEKAIANGFYIPG
ncbi:hypothetical protein CHU32_02620 [Superficieibacter electus]|uniref:Uncharacterized protein n=1 Tax=Superficieibacter electus TaxID=2022662 RepID=A0A2P5GUV2_9ENTR|nr:hypothetical protein CHU33_12730 [Superficieibacter electus]POP50336.1 hypothetical protein CHU32_02620 [Superficieibacter electus]